MKLRQLLLGRPLPDDESETEKLGVLEGVPVLGLDALASAAYGPEAALTALLALGAAGIREMLPITGAIIALLVLVQFSYRQTIGAYPGGGGSYTVARENLGQRAGLVAASALLLDYLLNVAIAISAGVGALVSAAPALLPLTLPACLALLALIALANLRGIRTAGALFTAPTYLFVVGVGAVILAGLAKALLAGGHPRPVAAPPPVPAAATAASLWLLLRAFANGCTAMTGVEAVSNAVPIFREERRREAQRTLTTVIAVLVLLLAGIALLAQAYRIGATSPGQAGYQSVLSQLTGAVLGRGVLYHLVMGSVIAVLCLSANTSFADFPRVCRVLALDGYLPPAFAHAGPRLVYSTGIVVLTLLAGALLAAFGGITDRLIPLFAVGALSAFTASQCGMVAHWRRSGGPHARRSMAVNGVGAAATGATLAVLIVAKFTEGAWLAVLFVPAVLTLLHLHRRRAERIALQTRAGGPVVFDGAPPRAVVVPVRALDRVTRKALAFALAISPDVRAVQVRLSDVELDDLARSWPALVEEPAREAGLPAPRLVTLRSEFRQVIDPLLGYVRRVAREAPGRSVAVLIPELVERRWYHFLLNSHTATALKAMLLLRGGPQIVIIDVPWFVRERRHRRLRRAPGPAASGGA